MNIETILIIYFTIFSLMVIYFSYDTEENEPVDGIIYAALWPFVIPVRIILLVLCAIGQFIRKKVKK